MELKPKDNRPSVEESDRKYILFALRIVGDFGATIAVPVVLAVLAGQWLDRRYEWEPLFTILGFALAALCSSVVIYRKTRQYSEEYRALGTKEPVEPKD